jgi:hypothetical protein
MEQFLISHIKDSLDKANQYTSKITDDILNMDGLTGIKTRHFYNNLCTMKDTRYLEIGTYTGSSLCSCLYNNNIEAVVIDNWSELFPIININISNIILNNYSLDDIMNDITKQYNTPFLPENVFYTNLYNFIGKNNVLVIGNNCWDIDPQIIGPFNIYLYDGCHKEESHFKALNHYLNCLDNIFIYLIDDWNWNEVRQGTLKSIENNFLDIIYQKEIFTNNQTHPTYGLGPGDKAGKYGDWHNGLCIFILKKRI